MALLSSLSRDHPKDFVKLAQRVMRHLRSRSLGMPIAAIVPISGLWVKRSGFSGERPTS